MSHDLSELAAAVVALPGWKWRQGMQAAIPADVLRGYERSLIADGSDYSFGVVGDWPGAVHPAAVPVLSDAATGGALLEMLMSAGWSVSVTLTGNAVALSAERHGSGYDIIHHTAGASLGEACARVAVKFGRWA
jgi:hypothetical protein